jgi:hypothetical protein
VVALVVVQRRALAAGQVRERVVALVVVQRCALAAGDEFLSSVERGVQPS